MTQEQFMQRYCSHLNEQQRQAVLAVDGPVLLLAVPGSGKTTVLVTRLGYMVCCRNIAPENILTMTYTVAATREMGERFSRQFGSYCAHAPEIRTINGLCQKIIDYCSETEGRPAFALQDDEGVLSTLVRELYRDYYADYPSESVIRDIRTAITYCKNSMFSQAEVEHYDTGLKHFADIYSRYNETLRRDRRMDYDDQLLYALNILRTRPQILRDYQNQFRYVCVDESQDTSRLQHEIIRLLVRENDNLFMVGDEDQSIYGFRAAFPDALNTFETDYPGATVLIMEQNYRSARDIVDAANAFVSANRFRRPKTIRTSLDYALPVQWIYAENRIAQYQYLFAYAAKCSEETAILSRNNDSAVPLIDYFERKGVLYNCRQFDETFFAHRILRDIEDIIHLSQNGRDTECFMRIYHKMGCMISKSAAEYACHECAKTGKDVLFELLRCPELGQYTASSVSQIYQSMQQLTEDSAVDALNRIRYQIGYGEYVERNKLDAGKFVILALLSRYVDSANGLLERLYTLQKRIRDHVNTSDARITLSTIHSSKGLEYDRVILLDVLDGILPGKTGKDVHTKDEIRLYEEERRLFYVGMTRAKRELSLFVCKDQTSEFINSVRASAPKESFEASGFLSFLNENHCGDTYHHRTYGKGRVLAQSEKGMLIGYTKDEVHFHTVDGLIQERKPQRTVKTEKTPEKMTKASSTGQFSTGDRVEHVSFGTGTVQKMDLEMITVVFDKDNSEKMFLKSAVIPTAKLHHLK